MLESYLIQKAQSHRNYKLYSTIEKLESTLKQGSFFLSNGCTWNDTVDRENFNSSNLATMNFGLCMSFSKSENVAMWMLYGGTQKRGAMFNIPPKLLKQSLSHSNELELGYFNSGNFITVCTVPKSQYKIKLIDILYYSLDSNNTIYTLKRADERYSTSNLHLLDALKHSKKTYPWAYENECRLIVTVNKSLIKDSKITSLKLPFPSSINPKTLKKQLVLAPNFTGSSTSNYNISTLSQKIDWDLCTNCITKCTSSCNKRTS